LTTSHLLDRLLQTSVLAFLEQKSAGSCPDRIEENALITKGGVKQNTAQRLGSHDLAAGLDPGPVRKLDSMTTTLGPSP
jgi:hypothetical protein